MFKYPMRVGALVLAGAAVSVSTAVAQDREPMTVEDVLTLKSVGSVAISPDGRWVAYVVTVRGLVS